MSRGGSRGGEKAVIAVDVGSNQDVTTGHIASAIVKYAKIKPSDIGDITLGLDESVIEVSPDIARHKRRNMKDATVNDFLELLRVVSDGSPGLGGNGIKSGGHRSSRSGKQCYRGGLRGRK